MIKKVTVSVLAAVLTVVSFLVNDHVGNEDFELTANMRIDEEIKPFFFHIVEGLQEAGVEIDLDQPIQIKIVDDLGEHTIGIAKGMFNSSIVDIRISRYWWYEMNNTEKYWALIHEMGHDFWRVFHHGNGIMRPYHREGETKKSLIKAVDQFIEELKALQRYEAIMGAIRK